MDRLDHPKLVPIADPTLLEGEFPGEDLVPEVEPLHPGREARFGLHGTVDRCDRLGGLEPEHMTLPAAKVKEQSAHDMRPQH